MTYAIRRAYWSFRESAAPYAMPICRSVSAISGKGKSNFSANRSFSSRVSKLTPRTCAFFASYCSMRSRNPEP
jgi:hypothetical protein